MAPRIKIDFNDVEVSRALDRFAKLTSVMAKAYNRTLSKLKKPTARATNRYYAFPESRIRDFLRVKKAKDTGWRVVGGKLRSEATRRHNVASFENTDFTNERGLGVTYELERGKPRSEHGFMIKAKGRSADGLIDVAIGRKDSGLGGRVPRYKTRSVVGISVPEMLENKKVDDLVMASVDVLQERNIDFYTKKAYRAYLKKTI